VKTVKHPIPSLLALTLWFPLRRRLGRATNTCWLRGGLNVLAPRMCGAIRPDGDHTSHSWWGPEPTHPIPNIAPLGRIGQMAALARARAMQERDRPTGNVWPNSCGQPQNPDSHALQAFPSSVNRMLVNRGNTYPVQMAPTLQPYSLSIFRRIASHLSPGHLGKPTDTLLRENCFNSERTRHRVFHHEFPARSLGPTSKTPKAARQCCTAPPTTTLSKLSFLTHFRRRHPCPLLPVVTVVKA